MVNDTAGDNQISRCHFICGAPVKQPARDLFATRIKSAPLSVTLLPSGSVHLWKTEASGKDPEAFHFAFFFIGLTWSYLVTDRVAAPLKYCRALSCAISKTFYGLIAHRTGGSIALDRLKKAIEASNRAKLIEGPE